VPLAFDSVSHGKIAFGFFNIETDLLLLNRYFFFASDFCNCLIKSAVSLQEGESELNLRGYLFPEERIGDLMGAIHGLDFRGFIGAVYRSYPFPNDPGGFRQNPEGFRTRPVLEELLGQYGPTVDIPLRFRREYTEVEIGEYRFDQENFKELILYVWLGGFPRWRDGRRPDYVEAMKNAFPFLEVGRFSMGAAPRGV
jgi:hypothetical protein